MKKPTISWVLQKFGGERGIRTPGPVTVNGFQDRRIRPLCHLSAAKVRLDGFSNKNYRRFFEKYTSERIDNQRNRLITLLLNYNFLKRNPVAFTPNTRFGSKAH